MPARIPIPLDTKAKAQAMYLQGIQPTVIAEELGLEKAVVRQWICRNKWKKSRMVVQSRVSAAVEARAEQAAVDEISRHTSHVQRVVRAKIDYIESQTPKSPVALVQQATALKTLDDIGRRTLGLSDADEGMKRPHTFNFNIGSAPIPSRIIDLPVAPVLLSAPAA